MAQNYQLALNQIVNHLQRLRRACNNQDLTGLEKSVLCYCYVKKHEGRTTIDVAKVIDIFIDDPKQIKKAFEHLIDLQLLPKTQIKFTTLAAKRIDVVQLQMESISKTFHAKQSARYGKRVRPHTERTIRENCKILSQLVTIDKYTLREIKQILMYVADNPDFWWSDKVLGLSTLRTRSKSNKLTKFENLVSAYYQENNKTTIGKKTTIAIPRSVSALIQQVPFTGSDDQKSELIGILYTYYKNMPTTGQKLLQSPAHFIKKVFKFFDYEPHCSAVKKTDSVQFNKLLKTIAKQNNVSIKAFTNTKKETK